MHSFFWLYLAINALDFQLIPLDRNTYVKYAYTKKVFEPFTNEGDFYQKVPFTITQLITPRVHKISCNLVTLKSALCISL